MTLRRALEMEAPRGSLMALVARLALYPHPLLLVLLGLLWRPAHLEAKSGAQFFQCHKRQSVTAPAPAPIQRPPRFEAGILAMGVESLTSTWAWPRSAHQGEGYDLYGAREQIGGYLAFSFQPWLSLGASFEVALPKGELGIVPGQLGPPRGASGGGGLHLGFHFKLSRRLRLDWVSDLWLYELAYRMSGQTLTEMDPYGNPVTDCPSPDPSAAWIRDAHIQVFLFRSQLSVGVDLGRVRLVAALGLRSVPHHITGGEASWSSYGTWPRRAMAYHPYLWLGVALPLGRRGEASLGLLQPLWADPGGYTPGIGMGLHFEAGDSMEGRR